MKKKKDATFELDPEHLPALSADERAELEALGRNGEVDTSDIPLLDDSFWRNAVRNPFYRPRKTQLTVRVDSDVLLWLKQSGRGYQTKLNGILRDAMIREVAKK